MTKSLPSVYGESAELSTKPLSLYLHFPFCHSKCPYCAFYSLAAQEQNTIDHYIDGLLQELAIYHCTLSLNEYHLTTIYLGGGTPSYVPLVAMERILQALMDSFGFPPEIEITIEANPDSVSEEKLVTYPSWGINRLSLGVQSSQDQHLATLGRPHQIQQVYTILEKIQSLPYRSYNLDFIFHIPGQNLNDLDSDLALIRVYQPRHISWYGLSYEEDTPFYRHYRYRYRESEDQAEILFRAMYLRIDEQLQKMGYDHYEVSNFSQPGYGSIHNQAYWNLGEYLGLGASAASYFQGRRFSNPGDISSYLNQIQAGRLAFNQPELRTPSDIRLEGLFLALRQARGLDISAWAEPFCHPISDVWEMVSRYIPSELWTRKDQYLVLTPQGFLLSNSIVLSLEGFFHYVEDVAWQK